MTDVRHHPVLVDAVVRLLDPRPGRVYVDGTVGLGGHAEALLKAESAITVIGIDRDQEALRLAADRLSLFGKRIHLIHGNYRDVGGYLESIGVEKIAGFFLDLGVSSLQLDAPDRGFSFRTEGPLDMRMDRSQGSSAGELVNTASEEALVDILFRCGEERFARAIVKAILQERAQAPIETTTALARIVGKAIPRRFHPKSIDPATRTFQALRIAVNQEITNLEGGLEEGFQCLDVGGVLAVTSFHSLEDRLVKRFIRYKALACVCPPDLPTCVCKKKIEAEPLTKRPIRPSSEEIAANPRARSARLRAARKVI
jgi:16S rRNA (cytosine1402-N4)-methyltransferase